jgi:uncharacterized membrane protein YsdA (DUF1294 family)
MTWLWLPFLALNLYTFGLMGWDKYAAGRKRRRIPERHFFFTAALGGSPGVFLAMTAWKHKRQKDSFKWRIYSILTFQILFVAWFFGRG